MPAANALLCGQLPFNPIIVTRQLPVAAQLGFRKWLLNNQINAHEENSLRSGPGRHRGVREGRETEDTWRITDSISTGLFDPEAEESLHSDS